MEIIYDDNYFLDADEGGMFTIEDPEINGSIVADGTFSSRSGLSYVRSVCTRSEQMDIVLAWVFEFSLVVWDLLNEW
jgi:hypothetical protein